MALCWCVSKEKNRRIFENKGLLHDALILHVYNTLLDWCSISKHFDWVSWESTWVGMHDDLGFFFGFVVLGCCFACVIALLFCFLLLLYVLTLSVMLLLFSIFE